MQDIKSIYRDLLLLFFSDFIFDRMKKSTSRGSVRKREKQTLDKRGAQHGGRSQNSGIMP